MIPGSVLSLARNIFRRSDQNVDTVVASAVKQAPEVNVSNLKSKLDTNMRDFFKLSEEHAVLHNQEAMFATGYVPLDPSATAKHTNQFSSGGLGFGNLWSGFMGGNTHEQALKNTKDALNQAASTPLTHAQMKMMLAGNAGAVKSVAHTRNYRKLASEANAVLTNSQAQRAEIGDQMNAIANNNRAIQAQIDRATAPQVVPQTTEAKQGLLSNISSWFTGLFGNKTQSPQTV